VQTRSLDTDLLSASSLPSRRPFGAYIVRDATDGKYYARRSGVWEPLQ